MKKLITIALLCAGSSLAYADQISDSIGSNPAAAPGMLITVIVNSWTTIQNIPQTITQVVSQLNEVKNKLNATKVSLVEKKTGLEKTEQKIIKGQELISQIRKMPIPPSNTQTLDKKESALGNLRKALKTGNQTIDALQISIPDANNKIDILSGNLNNIGSLINNDLDATKRAISGC